MSESDKLLKAVILVGGEGTRLRPLTYDIPKPMVPVLGRPFLEHTIAYLRQYGIKDIILAMNYLPESIKYYFNATRRSSKIASKSYKNIDIEGTH